MGKGFKFAIGYVLGNAMVGVIAAVIVTTVEMALDAAERKIRENKDGGTSPAGEELSGHVPAGASDDAVGTVHDDSGSKA